MQEIFNLIDKLNEKYLAVWEDVSNIESPTNCKEGLDKVGQYFIDIAKKLNFDIEVLKCEKAGNAVCITMNPDVKEKPIVFSGHIDTVHPIGLFGNPPVTKDNEKIYGPGVTDCKGGAVASLMAMEALALCNFKKRPVKLILQTDEETSSKESNKKTVEFMCEQSKDAVAFLNTEPTGDKTAILTRKGIMRYCFKITGRAAHSARCTEGASAIAEAATKILKLEKYKDINGITCNCGIIKGGTKSNTVAAECKFDADIRFADLEQLKEIKKVVEEVANTTEIDGCSCVLEEVSYRPAMFFSQKNRDLLDKMNEIYVSCGMPELTAVSGTGGSDAAYTTEKGIPTVDSIGVWGGYIHSKEEFGFLSSLSQAAKRLAIVAWYI